MALVPLRPSSLGRRLVEPSPRLSSGASARHFVEAAAADAPLSNGLKRRRLCHV